MRGRRLRMLAAALLAVVALCCFDVTVAYARDRVDETSVGSLTVRYVDEGVGVAGARIELRRVAEMSGFADFSPCEAFAGYSIDLEPEDAEGWRALAQTLEGYVARDGIAADAEALTAADGTATFPGLAPGLYLVTSGRVEQGGYAYVQEPALVSVPMEDEAGAWDYDALVNLKFEREPVEAPGQTVDVSAVKLWVDDEAQTRPSSVEVQLLRDGTVVGTCELSAENGWACSWEGLDAASDWHVVEAEASEGYTVTVRREGDVFVIENRARDDAGDPEPEEPEPTPEEPEPTPDDPGTPEPDDQEPGEPETPRPGEPESGVPDAIEPGEPAAPEEGGVVPNAGEPATLIVPVAACGLALLVLSWLLRRPSASERP